MKKKGICVFKCIGLLIFLLSCSFLTGCASIVSGSGPQAIVVNSTPSEAKLELLDMPTEQSVLVAKTPHTVIVKRSKGYFKKQTYKLKIEKEGYIPYEKVLSPSVTPWYILGNAVFGGLIGWLIVDPATGAMYKFSDEPVNVKLYPDTPEGRNQMRRDIEKREQEELEKRGISN